MRIGDERLSNLDTYYPHQHKRRLPINPDWLTAEGYLSDAVRGPARYEIYTSTDYTDNVVLAIMDGDDSILFCGEIHDQTPGALTWALINLYRDPRSYLQLPADASVPYASIAYSKGAYIRAVWWDTHRGCSLHDSRASESCRLRRALEGDTMTRALCDAVDGIDRILPDWCKRQ